MKKAWLSIWLCLCLMAGMTGAVAQDAGTTTTITVNSDGSFEAAAGAHWLVLPDLGVDETKGNHLGWTLGTGETAEKFVGADGTEMIAVYAPGVHAITAFDLTANGTFYPVYMGDDTNAPEGGYQFVQALEHTETIPIYAKRVDKTTLETPLVYKVELEWGDMQFAIGDMTDGLKIWDPTTHSYSWTGEHQPGEDEWYLVNAETYLGDGKAYVEKLTNEEHRTQAHILVFNHSNSPVNATVELEEVAVDTVTMGLTGEADYGVSTTADVELTDNGTDVSTYACTLNAGVVGEIYNLETDKKACAVVKVWPTSAVEDANKDLFPVTTAVAQLTITLDRTEYPAGAIVLDPPAT